MALIPPSGTWDDSSTWVDADTWFEGIAYADAGGLADIEQSIQTTATGGLADIEQIVNRNEPAGDYLLINQVIGYKGVGSRLKFQQEVIANYRANYSEILAFEQSVNRSENTGNMFILSQRVRSA